MAEYFHCATIATLFHPELINLPLENQIAILIATATLSSHTNLLTLSNLVTILEYIARVNPI